MKKVLSFILIFFILLSTSSCEFLNKFQKNIELTESNFLDYFSYDVKSTYSSSSFKDGEISVNFYPLRSLEAQDVSIEIGITASNEAQGKAWIYTTDPYYSKEVTKSKKIPYNGEFCITFSSDTNTEISWSTGFNISNYIDVVIVSASGKIILK